MTSDNTHTINVSEDAWERLQELREQGESMNETIERVLENSQDDRVLYSKFSILVFIGALLWLSSFALVGEELSNTVAGLFISMTLFWFIFRELAYYGLTGSNAE